MSLSAASHRPEQWRQCPGCKASVQSKDVHICLFCGCDLRNEPEDEAPRDWFFTFGHGQPHFGKYHVIHGTWAEARTKMHHRFGIRWSMMYTSKRAAGVERFGLERLP